MPAPKEFQRGTSPRVVTQVQERQEKKALATELHQVGCGSLCDLQDGWSLWAFVIFDMLFVDGMLMVY